MRSFLKQVLSTIIGNILAALLLFSIGCNITYHVIKQTYLEKETIDKTNMILSIELEGKIVEHIFEIPLSEKVISLSEISVILEAAAEDPDIEGLYLKLGAIEGGYDSIEALREIIQKFKTQSEKPIAIHANFYSEASLAFATVADHIILHSEGAIVLSGLSTKRLFFKSLLDHFDVQPIFYRAGKYKVGSFPYINDHMKEEDKKQWLDITQLRHQLLLQQIATRENVNYSDLEKIVNKNPLLSPKEAIDSYHLINKIGFQDSADTFFNKVLANKSFSEDETNTIVAEGKEPIDETVLPLSEYEEAPNYISYESYKKIVHKGYYETVGDIQVGILPLKGDIVQKSTGKNKISEEKTLLLLREYAENDLVKAIVIILETSGGGSIASANCGRAIEKAAKQKPVICLVRNGAFSGGLWIASSCTKILAASEATPLGSIGVWTLFWNFEKALKNHAFIDTDGVKTHEHADIFSDNFHEHSETEKALVEKYIQESYKSFKDHVQKNRKLTLEEIEAASEGIIYTAKRALELKIIDGIGTLQDAINLGLELADIDPEKEEVTILYPARKINLKGYLNCILQQNIQKATQIKALKLKGKKMWHAGFHLQKESMTT